MNKLIEEELKDFFKYYPDILVEVFTGKELTIWEKIYIRLRYGLRRCYNMKRIRIINFNSDIVNGNTVDIKCPYCNKEQNIRTYDLACTEDVKCECGATLISGYIAIK